jgi:hypothetical protein
MEKESYLIEFQNIANACNGILQKISFTLYLVVFITHTFVKDLFSPFSGLVIGNIKFSKNIFVLGKSVLLILKKYLNHNLNLNLKVKTWVGKNSCTALKFEYTKNIVSKRVKWHIGVKYFIGS